MINLLVIEDDINQRNNLIKMIKEMELDINIYEADGQEQALAIANKQDISFFYIDIELKNSSGLQLAQELRKIEKYKLSWIIFITSHVKFMLEAFKEIHCYDYIIKPFKKSEIQEMTKLLAKNAFNNKSKKENQRAHVIFNNRGIMVKIYIDEIIFLEVSLRNCTIHTTIGNYEITKMTLMKALDMINNEDIVQCHRAFAVNINYIKKIEPYTVTSWKICFRDTKDIAFMGPRFKENLLCRLNGII